MNTPRLAATLCLVVLVATAARAGSEEVAWTTRIKTAVDTAAIEGKPVLVDVWANWCVPCKQMDETTYRDPAVVAAAAAFVPLKVDHDLHEIFVERYRVEGLPAVLILDGEGRLVTRREGLIQAPAMLELLESVQAGYAAYVKQLPQARRDPDAAAAAAAYLLEVGNPTEAARLAKGALKRVGDAAPDRRQPLELLLARAQHAAEDYRSAEATFARLADDAGTPALREQALTGLARTLRARGKHDEADAAEKRRD